MQEKPAEEGKEVAFYDREGDERCWWFRMLKNAESFFAEESWSVWEYEESDGEEGMSLHMSSP